MAGRWVTVLSTSHRASSQPWLVRRHEESGLAEAEVSIGTLAASQPKAISTTKPQATQVRMSAPQSSARAFEPVHAAAWDIALIGLRQRGLRQREAKRKP